MSRSFLDDISILVGLLRVSMLIWNRFWGFFARTLSLLPRCLWAQLGAHPQVQKLRLPFARYDWILV